MLNPGHADCDALVVFNVVVNKVLFDFQQFLIGQPSSCINSNAAVVGVCNCGCKISACRNIRKSRLLDNSVILTKSSVSNCTSVVVPRVSKHPANIRFIDRENTGKTFPVKPTAGVFNIIKHHFRRTPLQFPHLDGTKAIISQKVACHHKRFNVWAIACAFLLRGHMHHFAKLRY